MTFCEPTVTDRLVTGRRDSTWRAAAPAGVTVARRDLFEHVFRRRYAFGALAGPSAARQLYTDGVIEARSQDGDIFSLERLADLLTRHLAGGLPTPETMRRVVRALLGGRCARAAPTFDRVHRLVGVLE